jgi:hypothetical protein
MTLLFDCGVPISINSARDWTRKVFTSLLAESDRLDYQCIWTTKIANVDLGKNAIAVECVLLPHPTCASGVI